jgi:DNA modification methylase
MRQTLLFPSDVTAGAGFRDSAFAWNKELPIHRWVPWVAGFSAHFVDDCLSKYVTSNGTLDHWILDPFSGVGTTLVQAFIRGFNVIGFEINPYAALASKAKLEAAKVDLSDFRGQLSDFKKFMKGRCASSRDPRSKPPSGFSGRTELFSPAVERKVLFSLDYISEIEALAIQELFQLALGSVMVSVSNYSYEPSLTRRSAVNKEPIEDADVANILSSKLGLIANDVEWLQSQLEQLPRKPVGEVHADTFFSAVEVLGREDFVDLVVTSPPYLNNYHYPRNTRPQLHWLGLTSGKGYEGAGETKSFGKFWQTVRGREPIILEFDLWPLGEIIEEIRGRNTDKAAYGGPGWANYVATYFNDTYRFCKQLSRLLKPEAAAVIVLGNSIIQGVEVKTDYFFGKIGELCGLALEDIIMLRKKRTGNSIIRSSVRVDEAAPKMVLYESAVVLKKKREIGQS